ncbi:uncharacterized protein K02A2.6-like [Corticium candelabrum]|uniref:uncharacterized protein K02A2.6-like n=1 Tax=Corticium candelabrum TaxID=121492 RepID=UPI002E272F62|nr:uncharacterized protein K02A2.6-like [Corticium candelabrum]
MYRSTPGRTPAELMFGRPIRTKFSLLRPNLRKTVEERQRQQRKGHDSPRMKERSFEQGEKVAIWNKQRGPEKWLQGTVIEAKGAKNYIIQTPDLNRMVHADDIVTGGGSDLVLSSISTPNKRAAAKVSMGTIPTDERKDTVLNETTTSTKHEDTKTTKRTEETATMVERRYPRRDKKPLVKLDL